jgi:hypothetical protein
MAKISSAEIAGTLLIAITGDALYEFVIRPYLARRYPGRLVS